MQSEARVHPHFQQSRLGRPRSSLSAAGVRVFIDDVRPTAVGCIEARLAAARAELSQRDAEPILLRCTIVGALEALGVFRSAGIPQRGLMTAMLSVWLARACAPQQASASKSNFVAVHAFWVQVLASSFELRASSRSSTPSRAVPLLCGNRKEARVFQRGRARRRMLVALLRAAIASIGVGVSERPEAASLGGALVGP